MKGFTVGRGLGWLSNQITSQIKGLSPSMAEHLIEKFANTLPKVMGLLWVPLTEKVNRAGGLGLMRKTVNIDS